MEATVYIELELEVEFTVSRYYPATYWQPSEGGDVEIESVTLNGHDIGSFLTEKQFEAIEEQIRAGLD